MTRSKFKLFYLSKHILRVLNLKQKGINKSVLKVWDRASSIPTDLVGTSVVVYDGKKKAEVPFT